jgi:hypothetical protein
METGYLEQLVQIFNGAVWDGNLICKSHRDILHEHGYITRTGGWNIITPEGATILINLNIAKS